MLNPAYQALERIQSKISTLKGLSELQALLKQEEALLTIKISPRSVWTLEWNVVEKTFSGVLELILEPVLTKGQTTLQGRSPKTLRLESPDHIDIVALEHLFLNAVHSAL
jgi:hypothetical protein